MTTKVKTIRIRNIYPYTYTIPAYASNMQYRYADRISTFINGEIKYDSKFLYKEYELDLTGSIDSTIEELESLKKRGCTSLATTWYTQPYEDATSTTTIVEDYPIPLYNEDGSRTKEGKDLQKVLAQQKKARAVEKERVASEEARKEQEALELLEKRGYVVKAVEDA